MGSINQIPTILSYVILSHIITDYVWLAEMDCTWTSVDQIVTCLFCNNKGFNQAGLYPVTNFSFCISDILSKQLAPVLDLLQERDINRRRALRRFLLLGERFQRTTQDRLA